MEHGQLIEMGQLTTVDSDGNKTEYKMALVIEFASTDEIRQAIKEGTCTFGLGDDMVKQLHRPPESWGPHTEADQIDHCGACGEEHKAGLAVVLENGTDVCPSCGAHNVTTSTWGEFQAERYRSGERYANNGPQPWEDGPQPARPARLTNRPNAEA